MTTTIGKARKFDDLISQAEAGRVRGVTKQAIANLISRGKLQTVSVAGRTLLYRSEVESFTPEPRLGRPAKDVPKKKAITKSTPKKGSSGKKASSKKAAPKKTTD